jgi:hypothetical protein
MRYVKQIDTQQYGVAWMLWACLPEVLGSTVSRNIVCFNWVPSGKLWTTIYSFQIIVNSLLTIHLAMDAILC